MKKDLYIGYIFVTEIDLNKYIGSILVTDQFGVPVEFKYTEPIIPTKVQEILYGKVLKDFIKRDVIANNLIKNIEKQPEIYLVKEDVYFDLYPKLKTPIILLDEPNEKPLEEVGTLKEIEPNIFLLQLSESVSPLKVMFSDDDKKLQDRIIEIMLKCSDKMDLIEPFARISEALNNIEI